MMTGTEPMTVWGKWNKGRMIDFKCFWYAFEKKGEWERKFGEIIAINQGHNRHARLYIGIFKIGIQDHSIET